MTSAHGRGLRLLADENVQRGLVEALRNDGFDVAYVADTICGISDEEVLELAVSDHRVIVTEDKDFGELVFRLRRGLPGVILMRFVGFDVPERHGRIKRLVERYGTDLYGRYVVVTPRQFRVRSMPAL